MKQFKYFISGVFTVLLVPHIIDKLLELFDVWVESLKINPNRKILEYKKDTALMSEFVNNSNNDEIEEEVIYYYGDEEDEE